jgi:hypothetical protein
VSDFLTHHAVMRDFAMQPPIAVKKRLHTHNRDDATLSHRAALIC